MTAIGAEPVQHTEATSWFAAYTNARHEKTVAQQLNERRIEHFLPLYRSLRHWKDRRKIVELALFPSYVFVRIQRQERLRVLEVPGVVSLVGFNGTPTALPEQEIEALRNGLKHEMHVEPCPYLRVGRWVRVIRGPFIGAEGILKKKKDNYRVIISVEALMRSVAVEVDGADLEPIAGSAATRRAAVWSREGRGEVVCA